MKQMARDSKRRLAYLSLAMLLLVILIAAGIASARLWGADRSELRSAAEGLQQLEQAGLCPYVRYDSFSTIGRVDCIADDPNTPLADYADSFTLSQYSDQHCGASSRVQRTSQFAP